MHTHDRATEELTEAIVRYSIDRMRLDPPPLDQPRSPQELREAAGVTITPGGLGGIEALRVFEDVLAPACISVDHPRFLSFVPAAPTEASILFDLVVGASSVYAGSWLEGAGAVHAENEALRWIADLAGLPRGRRRRLRERRYRWQPQRPDRGPVAVAAAGEWCPRPHQRVDHRVGGRPLVDRPSGASDGCRRDRGPCGRTRSHGRRCAERGGRRAR